MIEDEARRVEGAKEFAVPAPDEESKGVEGFVASEADATNTESNEKQLSDLIGERIELNRRIKKVKREQLYEEAQERGELPIECFFASMEGGSHVQGYKEEINAAREDADEDRKVVYDNVLKYLKDHQLNIEAWMSGEGGSGGHKSIQLMAPNIRITTSKRHGFTDFDYEKGKLGEEDHIHYQINLKGYSYTDITEKLVKDLGIEVKPYSDSGPYIL